MIIEEKGFEDVIVDARTTKPNAEKPKDEGKKDVELSDEDKNRVADDLKAKENEDGKTKIPDDEGKTAKIDDKGKQIENNKSPETKPNEKKDNEDAFKVNFDKASEKKPTPKEKEEKQDAVSYSQESVLAYLKTEFPNAFGEVESLTELSKAKKLADPVEAFNKFNTETGRGIKDFYNLQKDWNSEPKDDVIKEFYRLSEKGIEEGEVIKNLDILKVSDDDEVNLSAREVNQINNDYDRVYRNALSYLNDKSKEYQTPLESTQVQPKKQTQAEIDKAYRPYWEARNKAIEGLNEINLSTNIGDIKVPVSKEHLKLVTDATQTPNAFFDRWLNKDGVLDASKSTEDVLWSIKEVRQTILSEMLKQANTLTIEEYSRENRHVDLDKPRKQRKVESSASVTVTGDSPEDNRMGQPLIKN